ncbi:hypothetical protein DITRI_Ditri02bG0149000 [Diplodiscus trichospermus]
MTFIFLKPFHIFSSSAYSSPFSFGTKNPSPYRPLLISSTFSPSELSRNAQSSSSQSNSPRTGADVLVKALERHGVTLVFAYPGGASMHIHVALTRSSVIRTIIPRHEQGGIFAAEGYARSSGVPGVCITSSGPGATNIVTGLADALLDSIPLIAITGQVSRTVMGTNAFQEIPIAQITRPITKHNFLVLDVQDIPRIFDEAFFIATSGRPGPVLIDVPKDIQKQLVVPNWNQSISLSSSCFSNLPTTPEETLLYRIVSLLFEAKKPVLYIGGGCLNSSLELNRFVELTGIPVASTLMGLGCFPCSDDLSLQMLGIFGTVYANYAMDQCDLLLAFGVRFDERATRKIEEFATRSKIVHIDIDIAEIGKNKQPHLSVLADLKFALKGINKILESEKAKLKLDFSAWRKEINEVKTKFPPSYQTNGDAIPAQYAIEVLDELTNGNAIITTGVGQHQMWAAQFYKYKRPRQLLTSGGLGTMGFGLPAAIGAALANPGTTVVDIDGDGSFTMNIQEMATVHGENLPIKILLLNDQHLGMVAEWAYQFCPTVKPHSYLGDSFEKHEIFPDMIKISEGFKITAARITKKKEVRRAIQKMLESHGPYLLDVIISPSMTSCNGEQVPLE